MSKIRVNLQDLETALSRSGLTSYSDDKRLLEVDLEIIEGNDPGDGAVVDVLTITLDKQEKTYAGTLSDVKYIVEVFPADKPHLDNRITTQKYDRIVRAAKKKEEGEDVT